MNRNRRCRIVCGLLLVAGCLSFAVGGLLFAAGGLSLDACCSSAGVVGVSCPIFRRMVADCGQNRFYKRADNGQNSRWTGKKILNLKMEMGRSIKRSCSASRAEATRMELLLVKAD